MAEHKYVLRYFVRYFWLGNRSYAGEGGKLTTQNGSPNRHVFSVRTYSPIWMILPRGGDEYLAKQMQANICLQLMKCVEKESKVRSRSLNLGISPMAKSAKDI